MTEASDRLNQELALIAQGIEMRNKQKRRFRILWGFYDEYLCWFPTTSCITLFELKFHGWEYFGTRNQHNSHGTH